MDPKVDAFLEMLAVERGAARNTIAAYTIDLTDFADFAQARGQTAVTADAPTCQAWMASLHKRGLSARTAARRLSALRQFHQFLLREGVRQDDPTSRLDMPRLPQPLPKFLSESEVDALLQAAADKPGRPGVLARVALELLYATGMRVSELLSVPRVALGAKAEVMIIKGKGGKERMVPLSATAKQAALALLAATGTDSRYLFPGRNPKQPMTRQAFFLLLKQVALAGAGSGAGVAARAAALLCLAHAGARGGSAQPADAAGTCGHRDRADLYACADRAAAAGGGDASSAVGAMGGLRGPVANRPARTDRYNHLKLLQKQACWPILAVSNRLSLLHPGKPHNDVGS